MSSNWKYVIFRPGFRCKSPIRKRWARLSAAWPVTIGCRANGRLICAANCTHRNSKRCDHWNAMGRLAASTLTISCRRDIAFPVRTLYDNVRKCMTITTSTSSRKSEYESWTQQEIPCRAADSIVVSFVADSKPKHSRLRRNIICGIYTCSTVRSIVSAVWRNWRKASAHNRSRSFVSHHPNTVNIQSTSGDCQQVELIYSLFFRQIATATAVHAATPIDGDAIDKRAQRTRNEETSRTTSASGERFPKIHQYVHRTSSWAPKAWPKF